MKNKLSVIVSKQEKNRFIDSFPLNKVKFICSKEYKYYFQQDKIIIQQINLKNNVIPIAKIIQINELYGVLIHIEKSKKKRPQIIISFLQKTKNNLISFFITTNLKMAFINWRLLANYYKLDMYFLNNEENLVKVREKQASEYLTDYKL